MSEYTTNLEKLVRRLKQTDAKLIWRPTTPAPEGARGRIPADLPNYNPAALKVIERHGIEVDDMNSFIKDQQIPHVRPHNVHFSKDSSALMAANSASLIRQILSTD